MKTNEAASEDPRRELVPCRTWLLKINHEHVFCTTRTPGLFSIDVERPRKRKGCSRGNSPSFQVSFSADKMEEVLADTILQGRMSHISEERVGGSAYIKCICLGSTTDREAFLFRKASGKRSCFDIGLQILRRK